MRVGGARPPPLITFTLTSKVAVYTPAEWADTLTMFHLYQYMYSVVKTEGNTAHLPAGGDGGGVLVGRKFTRMGRVREGT